VLVTTGSQQALDLVATAVLDPGDVVLVERPSYLAALQVFALTGARVVSVPLDDDGLDPEQVRAELRRHRAKLVYTVPNFQNPAGVTLAAERRRALGRVAAEEGAWVLEDDPYGELRYRGEALPPVAAGEPERVIYASSLSKILAPGLRLGWLVVPPGLRDAITVVKQARDLHTSTVDQRAAAVYLVSGALPPHLGRIRAAYGARLDAMLAGLPGALPPGSRWTRPEGGMFVWLTLPEDRDLGAILPRAVQEGVAYVPGAPFFAGTPLPHTARLSFATLEPPQIAEALRRLARALA
jgi:2-aminoadipate transaminase